MTSHGLEEGQVRPPASDPAGGPRALPHPQKARAARRGQLSFCAFGKFVRGNGEKPAALSSQPGSAPASLPASENLEATLEAVSKRNLLRGTSFPPHPPPSRSAGSERPLPAWSCALTVGLWPSAWGWPCGSGVEQEEVPGPGSGWLEAREGRLALRAASGTPASASDWRPRAEPAPPRACADGCPARALPLALSVPVALSAFGEGAGGEAGG